MTSQDDEHALAKYESVTCPKVKVFQTPSTAAENLEINCSPLASEDDPIEEAKTQPDSGVKRRPTRRITPKQISKPPRPEVQSTVFERLMDRSRSPVVRRPEQTPAAVPCPYCGRRFPKTQSLGGHISKKHPGKSVNYAEKQRKRDENEEDRDRRKEAKELFKARTRLDPAAHRQRITEIKKILLLLNDSKTTQNEQEQLESDLEGIFDSVINRQRKV